MMNVHGIGRKRKTTVTIDRFIKQLALKNRKLSAVKSAAEVKQASSVNIMDQTYNATGWPEESL